MKNTLICCCLLLFMPCIAAAEWVLTASTVYNGELAVLRWQGGSPPDMMVGSFDGKVFYAEVNSLGPVALVGVDIDTPVGRFPLRLVSVSNSGELLFETLLLEIQQKDRGTSRITLPPEMVTPKAPDVLARISQERMLLDEIFAQSNRPLIADLFRRPVSEAVNSPFGKKRVLNGLPRAPHSGVDFRSPAGRLVRTPARGEVVFNGDLYYTGNTVILDHGAGLYTLYAHLSKPLCLVGQQLEPGQPLGKVGSTGRSTGAHLHWTARLREIRIDPMSILERFGSETP